MDTGQQEAISVVLEELTSIKYELSLYVDEELIDLGARFDKALEILTTATNTAAVVGR